MEEEDSTTVTVHDNNGRTCWSRFCDGFTLTVIQFLLLLWKNFLLQIRRPIGTVFEILVPIAAVGVIIAFRLALFTAEDQCFVTFDSDPLVIPNLFPYSVYYSPNTSEAAINISQHIQSALSPSNGVLIGRASQDEMLNDIRRNGDNRTNGCFLEGAGIYFENLEGSNISYSIRLRQEPSPDDTWYTEFVSRRAQPRGARIKPNFYLNEGFLHLEKIVDEAIVKWATNDDDFDMDVQVRQFPYPKYRKDLFLQIVDFILPLFIILSFIFSAGVFVKEIVLEKESRIKETMKMMGLSNWILWTSWFTKQVLFYLIPIVLMTLLLRFAMVFPKSDVFLVFVYLMMYMISGIAFCFFVSVWFSSARIGLMAGFICWFVAYFPYLFAAPRYETLSLGAKLGICIIPNSCVGFGVTVLSVLELRQEGLTYSNFASPLTLDDPLHMGWIILMLAIDTFIYMVLYWYIDAVKPGRYGVPKPFYFVFLPSYWCGYKRSKSKKSNGLETYSDPSYVPDAHEAEPTNLKAGIVIDNLTKIYNKRNKKKRKVAVDHLSLKMYKGQITALLGHNGAGKTTTMSILTGLFPPTDGSALINGLNVVDDIDLIRRNLGICPQHNVLFDRLTVSEHLHFFARLKGARGGQIKKEIDQLIEDLLLKEKRKIQSRNLSGGMKRKLSVGIALVGGSEVVILDEPTSGMDPYARRATWDLLAKYKEGKTMLLTTHFMDEADLLGDRIAIMSEGKLKCTGSSLFLKGRYGVGYHMTMVKTPDCNSQMVSDLVKQIVQGAEQSTDVGAELSFILPGTSSQQFPQLFDVLEDRKTELGISSFGVSVTTMEEVFIRVSSGTDNILLDPRNAVFEKSETEAKPLTAKPPTTNETVFLTDIENDEEETQTAKMVFINEGTDNDITPAPTPQPAVHYSTAGRPSILEVIESSNGTTAKNNGPYGTFQSSYFKVNTGIKLWLQQFLAIFLKSFYNSIRFWAAVIWQFIIPLIFVLWGLILGKTLNGFNSDDPSRLLSVSNSAPSDNITFFWAQFNSTEQQLFVPSNIELLGLTDYFNLTNYINEQRESIASHNDINQCCNYDFQLLDKYCATRTPGQFSQGGTVCPNNENFGYRSCTDCLSCCRAKSNNLNTCTNPLQQDISDRGVASVIADGFCPLPPSVSINEQSTTPPSGPLDDINVFVAERLLNISSSIDVYDFSLRYQAGYVLHLTPPTYSTCGIQNNTQDACASLGYSLLYPNRTVEGSGMGPNLRFPAFSNSCLPIEVPSSCVNESWNYGYNYITDGCSAYWSCGEQSECGSGNNRGACQVGSTSQPAPPTSSKPTLTVWYNNQPYHMIAASLNGFYNIYLRSRGSNRTISVTNHPLPRNLEAQILDAQREFLGFTISSTAIFGLSFLFASFVIVLVQERDSKAKHLQFVSGVQASSYWLAVYAWDLLNAFIPAILTAILFASFQIDGYKGENIGAIFMLVVLGCWAAIPLNYVASFLFSNALVAFCIMLIVFYFGSLIFQVVIFLLIGLGGSNADTATTLNYVFLLHPSYALANGLTSMYTNQGIKNACEQSEQAQFICRQRGVNYADTVFKFESPGIGHIFLYMTIEGALLILLTIAMERSFFIPELKRLIKLRHNSISNGVVEFPDEDDDVHNEKRKVNEMTRFNENDAVVVKNLVKEYKDVSATLFPCIPNCQSGTKLAVNSISLLIPSGECFGLLGVNGAGKTTTFKMLTGDIPPTDGTAVLNGYDIRTQLRQVQQRIGYCPQFDALIERLTGRELLTMFARLRGIPEKAIKGCVQTEIERLDLLKHADKKCGTYSGGNKRKLSTAVALVGNPAILLLDEPTTGMDPATRRFLWDVLTGVIREEGRSVILTSHSMEECEALCTRLAIMVNGQFKCLGSIQHLKSKFGSGYTLQLKVQPKEETQDDANYFSKSTTSRLSFRRSNSEKGGGGGDLEGGVATQRSGSARRSFKSPSKTHQTDNITEEVQKFITDSFPGSLLLEHHQGSVTYRIPAEGVTWSTIFRTVEDKMEELNITDYSVSQTTLDQVFINFAQEQEESDL